MKSRILFLVTLWLLLACQQQNRQTDGPAESLSADNQGNRSPILRKEKVTAPSGQIQQDSLVQKGVEIAMEGQKLLGFHLMKEIQENGTLSALKFCNLQAIPLTDSVASKFDVEIRRVSDRYRNPKNAAKAREKELIRRFQEEISSGKAPQPVVQTRNDSKYFYYPLVTNTLCLQCHGKPAEMEPGVRDQIMRLYPQDLATGYSENEVRGAWKIQFKD